MTRPPLNRPVEAVLPDWMEEVAPDRAPGRLLEEAFARTMRAPQSRIYPWDRLLRRGPRAHRPNLPRTYVLGGVAAALILTFGVAMLALRPNLGGIGGSPLPAPSVAPTASPSAAPSPPPSPTLTPISVTPESTIAISGVIGMASDGQGVWLFTAEGKLAYIDPTTNAVVASVALSSPVQGYGYQGLAVNKDGLWITNWDTSLVERFDPVSLKPVGSTAVGPNPKGVLVTDSAVWIANTRGGSVSRIDPATNTIVATISVGPTGLSGPNWLAEGLGSIWVGVPNANAVVRIDEVTNAVIATIIAPRGTTPCGAIAVEPTAVWITSCDSGNLLARIDPTTNLAAASVDLGGRAYTMAIVAGAPWLSPTSGNLVRVNPATNAIDRVIAAGSGLAPQGGDVVIAAGSLWLTDGPNNQLIRLPLSAFGG